MQPTAPARRRPVVLPLARERACQMFAAQQYRAKAAEFRAFLTNTSRSPNETREFRDLRFACIVAEKRSDKGFLPLPRQRPLRWFHEALVFEAPFRSLPPRCL